MKLLLWILIHGRLCTCVCVWGSVDEEREKGKRVYGYGSSFDFACFRSLEVGFVLSCAEFLNVGFLFIYSRQECRRGGKLVCRGRIVLRRRR